jgi:hypothetical protein
MLSHRYGSRFLLEGILQSEFAMIKQRLEEKHFELAHKSGIAIQMSQLLDCFYECDFNDALNKMYKIRSNDEITLLLNKQFTLRVRLII